MNLEIVLLESCMGILLIIALIILKHFQISPNYSKLFYCVTNLGIFLLQVKYIGHLDYSLLGITFALIAAFYYKQPKKTQEIPKNSETPQINVFKTQISFADQTNKIENELELPKKLQVIQSIHESESSLNPAPNTNDEAQKQNSVHKKAESGQSQQDNKKPLSPLLLPVNAESKNVSVHPPVVARKSSLLQIQPNLNVIKFQDDLGEVKFGILKTLKSVSYDQVGREVEGIMRADTDKQLTHLLSAVEQTNEPRMQILYESQQPEYKVDDKLRGAIHFDQLGYAPQKQEKLITWRKIFKELICLFVLGFNILKSEQIFFLGLLFMRIIMAYSKLQNNSLNIVFEMREMLIWFTLIIAPLLGILIINIIDPQLSTKINQFTQWLVLILTLRYSKIVQKNFIIFSSFLVFMTAAMILC